ncbi:MAG: tetratricopeptide repeat protein [Gammaproteobacteria bacterium]|nr:tetratricopeptide repeat protein [Gammaproteobacteria bacterium]
MIFSRINESAFRSKLALFIALLCLMGGCAAKKDTSGTLATLEAIEFKVVDEKVTESLAKAMASYEEFLKNTPETEMTPEAMRRLADLKIQQEQYNEEREERLAEAQPTEVGAKQPVVSSGIDSSVPTTGDTATGAGIEAPETGVLLPGDDSEQESIADDSGSIAVVSESEEEFGERAGQSVEIGDSAQNLDLPEGEEAEAAEDLMTVGAMEAIEIYKNLLKKYPLYERNDQVVYQLSRAYEDSGQIDIAMDTIKQLIEDYPDSRHIDESRFRLAEYYFTRRKFLDAEENYMAIVSDGESSEFYELSLYKLGWSYFKQELYEEALTAFINLLDYKIDNGFDLDNVTSKIEKKRLDDTYRVISLGFSYLEGPESIVEFFRGYGARPYEASIYSHLGEHYLSKLRYADATRSYQTYIDRNTLSREAPYFSIRVIEIYEKGGFPKLVIENKKTFANAYGRDAEYWTYFDINESLAVLAYMKSNLTDLANHYHALYQNKSLEEQKEENYQQAVFWYREFLATFFEEVEAPGLNNQLAGLMLEHKDYFDAAREYEQTAYNYLPHPESANAGYAAVYAYREHYKIAEPAQRTSIKREIVRSSIRFAETYPDHKHAIVVLVAAVDELYELEDFERAIIYGKRVVEVYPDADPKLRRSAWMVVAHSSFNVSNYQDAELAYSETLLLTDINDESYESLSENLAASIYKQGEQALKLENHQLAANHFLRVAEVTPNSKIRPTAEYDAAASLIALQQWQNVADLLEGFRQRFPQHELLPDITKKLAIVYKEDGRILLAAAEFERIEEENPQDEALRREALYQAADLYDQAGTTDRILLVYQKLVDYFPEPIEEAIETHQKMADIYQQQGNRSSYLAQLENIVVSDATGGSGRTDRTRYLAAHAALVLAEPKWEAFSSVELVRPFRDSLVKKKDRMSVAIETFSDLIDYEVGDVTAAATFYLAEIYLNFSASLINSERPEGLDEIELEDFELAIEDQAFPFEEKGINVHERNLELLDAGIYNKWIDNSLAKLADLLPARYAKTEQDSNVIALIQPPKPVVEIPIEGMPVDEAPVEEVPVDEAPVEEVPVDEAPVEEVPVEEAPVDEVPVEEAPVDEAPVDEASVESTTQQEPNGETPPVEGDESTPATIED